LLPEYETTRSKTDFNTPALFVQAAARRPLGCHLANELEPLSKARAFAALQIGSVK
jgi:hypothetical protein